MPETFVRYIVLKAGRFIQLGADAESVSYYEHDREADAIADGEAWIAGAPVAHPWYVVYGQEKFGRLVWVAGEDT